MTESLQVRTQPVATWAEFAKRIAFAASTSWPKTLEQLGIVGQLYQVCTDGGRTKGMAGNVIYIWRRHVQYEVVHRKFQE